MNPSLPSGTKLGRYEIRSKIGEGGMGEVYLAEDMRLHRKVALKILPADVVSNQDRMRRFNQEATAAAALNHPHVAHIYEIGEADGTNFIAMEFIDGETLREKIHRDRTELKELLKYLQQVAEGLSKAHAVGIVHRDLKPDNIMITREGYAKILDFGLAKLIEKRGPGLGQSEGSDAPTALMQQHSVPGVVMGSVGYMSPEQAQGRVQEVDHRSDIFSLGCLLFEAATAKRAFEGKDALDSLNKIVHAPTPQIKDFNASAPDELQRIVRRCLAKEPEKRYQSIKDVAIELEELRQVLLAEADFDRWVQPTLIAASAPTGPSEANSAARIQPTTGAVEIRDGAEYLVAQIKRHKRGVLAVLAVLVVIVTGLSFWLYRLIHKNMVTMPMGIRRLTNSGKATHSAISPDGRYVVHVVDDSGQQSLWLRHVATDSNVQILLSADVQYLGITFSHDGNFIYYVRVEKDYPTGVLYEMPVLGGTARRLIDNIISAITFSPDGKRLAFVRGDFALGGKELIIANADGTEEKTIARRERPNQFGIAGPAWSPDGKTIAFVNDNYTGGHYVNVVGVGVESGTEKAITSQRWGAIGRVAWLSDGSGLVVSAAEHDGSFFQIWHLSFPSDATHRVTNDLNNYADISLTADSGILATVRTDSLINIWIASSTDSNRIRQITSGIGRRDGTRGLSWTPDGKTVYLSFASGTSHVWMMEADGTGSRQLSVTGSNYDPTVSPDGRYIVWSSNETGTAHVWRMAIDGGNRKQLTNGGGEWFPQCTPDGKWVVYTDYSPGLNIRSLWKVPIDGGNPQRLTESRSAAFAISSDGKLIAYNYFQESGSHYAIAVISFDAGEITKVFDIPAAEGSRPIHWIPDGTAVAYIRTSGGVSNIWAQPLDGGPQKQLTDFKDQRIFNFAWSRDGKQLALSRGVSNTDVVLITNFK